MGDSDVNVVKVGRTATLGGGCFWCTQAVFSQLRGVSATRCGYSGGKVAHPTYQQVSEGNTGHVEAVQITYDPAEISYRDLLEVFFQMHDPTEHQTQQLPSHQRSVIFYHDPVQRQLAEDMIEQLNESEVYETPIATELVPLTHFYPAEEDHQDFFRKHPLHPFCMGTIRSKLEKCRAFFPELVAE